MIKSFEGRLIKIKTFEMKLLPPKIPMSNISLVTDGYLFFSQF